MQKYRFIVSPEIEIVLLKRSRSRIVIPGERQAFWREAKNHLAGCGAVKASDGHVRRL
jgi:hypothetical protein